MNQSDKCWDDYFTNNNVVECEINGIIQHYDACSSKTLEVAIEYYNNFYYIGSNNGVIYVNGVKNDFKSPHHFFKRLTKQELRQKKLKKLKIMKKRILLDEGDFKKLTKGEIIEKDNVQIALSDIGYIRMVKIISDNHNETNG